MGIERIIKETTIEFERPLDLKNVRRLFLYIAKNLPGSVRYTVESKEIIERLYRHPMTDFEQKSISINGSIDVIGTGGIFKCESPQDNHLLINTLKFDSIPGYDYEEHQPAETKLWGDVRRLISDYFKEKSIK